MQCKRKATNMYGQEFYTAIIYCHAKSFKALKKATCKLRYPVNQLEQEKLKESNIEEKAIIWKALIVLVKMKRSISSQGSPEVKNSPCKKRGLSVKSRNLIMQ